MSNKSDITDDTKPVLFNNKEEFYAAKYPIAFIRGMWDGVQFGYVPDFESEELTAWAVGLQYIKRGGSVFQGEGYLNDLAR